MGLTFNNGRNAAAMTSTSSLSVGINCTPNSQFEVLGSTGGALTDGIRVSRNTLQSSQYGVINYTSGILNLTGVNTSGGGEIRFNTSDGTTTNERMRITSAGNVGIGTSSPVPPASRGGLVVRGNSNGGEIMLQNTDSTDGSAYGLTLVMVNNGGGTNSGDGGLLNRNNGFLNFATNNTERMRITSAGNVGISTSTPYSPLQVNGNIHRAWTSAGTTGSPASEEGFVYSEQSNSNALAGMWFENNFQSGSAVSVVFKYRSNGASVTEGMRLTAGGLLSIGTSNPYFNTPGLLVGGSGSSYFGVWQEYSGSSVGLEMTNNAGTLKIQFFGSSGNYYFAGSNISDRRAKSNIQEITEGLSKISKLKPSTFTYDKNPDIVKGGFIAQEVLEVIPEFVTIPEDENEMMGVDYFGILALAVKSIQELEARLKTLENK